MVKWVVVKKAETKMGIEQNADIRSYRNMRISNVTYNEKKKRNIKL